MGQARELMDRVTAAARTGDHQLEFLGQLGLGEQTVVLPEQARAETGTGAGART